MLEEEIGMKEKGKTYDKKASRHGIGKPMMCVCFHCAGALVHGDEKFHVLNKFLGRRAPRLPGRRRDREALEESRRLRKAPWPLKVVLAQPLQL